MTVGRTPPFDLIPIVADLIRSLADGLVQSALATAIGDRAVDTPADRQIVTRLEQEFGLLFDAGRPEFTRLVTSLVRTLVDDAFEAGRLGVLNGSSRRIS